MAVSFCMMTPTGSPPSWRPATVGVRRLRWIQKATASRFTEGMNPDPSRSKTSSASSLM